MEQDKETVLYKNRLSELAERSYAKGIYTFTDFLTLAEQSVALDAQKELAFAGPSFFGGADFCERKMLRFGKEEELGYEQPFPITLLKISPSAPAFASELSHRDFLGSLMNLGIERAVLGDILLRDNTAYLFCCEHIAQYIMENLVSVRREKVTCSQIEDIRDLPEGLEPKKEIRRLSVASLRLDSLVAGVWHVSRTDAVELIEKGTVYINQKLCLSPDKQVKENDLVTVRGKGRFTFLGVNYMSRKGRDNVSVELFV